MSSPIVPFTPELLPALVRFCERTWRRPRTAAYYRWRYLESPLQRAWLVMREGECIGTLLAFARPYRCGSETVTFLEVHDWFALPELKGAGLGVRLIRHAMSQPEPVLMVGGSDDSRKLMPRLGYGEPATAQRWMLPVAGHVVGQALQRRARLPAAIAGAAGELGVRAWFRAPRVRAPEAGRVVPVGCPGDELAQLYAGASHYGTVPLWPKEHLAWFLNGFAGVGHFVPLYFTVRDALRGWALGRVVSTKQGCEAALVTLFAPQPDAALYGWMVSAAVTALSAFRPNSIQASTTCPLLSAALGARRFLRVGNDPVWVAPKERELPGPVAIGLDTGDTPLLPYPELWWDDNREEALQ
jgi:hypothetical protein